MQDHRNRQLFRLVLTRTISNFEQNGVREHYVLITITISNVKQNSCHYGKLEFCDYFEKLPNILVVLVTVIKLSKL